ncbi:MAG: hypothetical protein ACLFS9_11860 [Nitriliruptoraceae bacterium]
MPPEVDLSTGEGLRHEAAVPVWYGMVWGRLGRGDLAWAQWDRVRLAALQPWIAAERGRLLRELGDHLGAAALEWPALAAAEDPVDQLMLRVSLAADAVGIGDLAAARRRLAGARDLLAEVSSGPLAEVSGLSGGQEGRRSPVAARLDRQRLRAAWVAVEVALLAGEPPPTDLLPHWAEGEGTGLEFPTPYASGTAFHRAKGCLFAGVVGRDRTMLEIAARDAPPALRWAVELALASLGGPDAEDARARGLRAREAVVPPPGLRAART